jgi:hypothetical protein
MARWKLALNLGQTVENSTRATGTAISGNDGIELNIDQTKMSKRECIVLIDELKQRVLQAAWPEV